MENTAKTQPKCIVMPFQETRASGAGLALHFLLGNVIAVHTGFAECWFGWRVGKIFATPAALRDYGRLRGTALDKNQICAEQKVRCWIYGTMQDEAVSITWFDSRRKDQPSASLVFSTADHLVAFRNRFLDWLGGCGFALADERRPMALWPEKTTLAGLQGIGKALEKFYIYSAYGVTGAIDLAPFSEAVRLAPESFMAHNLLGWAHYRNQAAARAKSSFLRALELNPDAVGPMAGLMWCAVLEKDESAAIHWATLKAAKCEEDCGAAVEKARRHVNA
jgi:hypothetical protein